MAGVCDVMDALIYYKCTACSECFMKEEIFFAHTRTWHCKLLISEGQNPSGETWNDNNQYVKTEPSDSETGAFTSDAELITVPSEISQTYPLPDLQALNKSKALVPYSKSGAVVNSNFGAEQTAVAVPRTQVVVFNEASWNDNVEEHEDLDEFSDMNVEEKICDVTEPATQSTEVAINQYNVEEYDHQMSISCVNRPKMKTLPSKKNVKPAKVFVSLCEQEPRRESVYLCRLCKKPFYSRSKLLDHEYFHTGIKPFECQVCHKGFAQISSVARHMLIHTGEKPHKCRYCKRGFNQSSPRFRHERRCGENPQRVVNTTDLQVPVSFQPS